MSRSKAADLVLFAGFSANEAFLAFGKFKDDPLAIVPWRHSTERGKPLAWWHCEDWESLYYRMMATPDPAAKAGILRDCMPAEAVRMLEPASLLT